MLARTDRRVAGEGAHRNVNELAVTNHGIEERSAHFAAGITGVFIANEQQPVCSLRNAKLASLDSRERFESRASRSPASGAVTVGGIEELVRYCISDGAARTLSCEGALRGLLETRHGSTQTSAVSPPTKG